MVVQVAPIQETIRIDSRYLKTERVLDLFFSLLILLPLCCIVLIVAIAIRLDSEGPVFFRQKRVGLRGTAFTMYKFRSMRVNSDDSFHKETIVKYMNGQKLSENVEADLSYKQVGDPRITRVGR